jgi:hypothetical protein
MQTGIEGIGAALGGSTLRRGLLLLQVNRSTHQACHMSMPLQQRESGAQSVEVGHETFARPIYPGLRNGSMRDAWRSVA